MTNSKNNDIELLRAISILMVITSHFIGFFTWSPSWLVTLNSHTYFWGGVDLFFCISGFLITKSLVNLFDVKCRHQFLLSTFSFWVKRFYRLVPVAIMFMIIRLVLSNFYNESREFGDPSANFIDIFAQLFHISNFRYYYCFSGYSVCGNNAHYWSLSLEEQFYILLPVLIYFFKDKIWIPLILAILIQFPIERQIFTFGWIIRTDALSWGCLIALASSTDLYKNIEPRFLSNRIYSSVFCLILVSSICVFAKGEVARFFMGLIALSSAALVFIASYDKCYVFGKLANNPVVLWIGSRSYSIYLSHALGFVIVRESLIRLNGSVSATDTFKIFIVGFALTAIMSELAYRFIEVPLRNRGKLVAKKITS